MIYALPPQLPPAWQADWGEAVPYDGETLYLYGDTITPLGFVQGTTVQIGDIVIPNALAHTASGSWYWPLDGYEMADGSLFLLAAEVVSTGSGPWDFEGIDTDAFIIGDPRNPMSWALAAFHKIEDGPWNDWDVMFLDQYHIAAVQESPDDTSTSLYSFDPADPTAPWTEIGGELPRSDGPFSPVQTADGWVGVSWGYGWAVTVWHADEATGPWTAVTDWGVGPDEYNHSLNIIDGQVVLRWSQMNGRVEYHTLEEVTT